jgi:MFS family permease
MFNAVSYICLADNLLILFALEMKCPDYYVAVLASFMYICNVFMVLGKHMVGRMGATNAIGACWVGRNLSALLTASAPLFAAWVSPLAGMAVLTLGAFCFYSFRAAGVVAMQPLIGEITSRGNRGKFISLLFKSFNFMCLATLAVIIVVLTRSQSSGTFQKILLSGSLIGGLASLFVFLMKESPGPRDSALKPIKDALRKVWSVSSYRKLLFANIAGFSGIMLVVPISMLALKESYNVPNYQAMLYSMVQFTGGILISYLSGILSEETGPRPLAVLYFSLFFVVSIIWVVAPYEYLWYFPIFIFLLTGAGLMGIPLSLGHYFLTCVEEKDRVGVGLFINISSGLSAGAAGAIFGSVLLKLLRAVDFENSLDVYKVYFGIVFLILLPGVYMIYRMNKQEDWEVADVLGLAIAPRDIRALLLLNKLDIVSDPRKERQEIDKLEHIPSGLSERKLLQYLDSPLFLLRGKAIQALRQMPSFSEETKKALLRELEYGEHTTAFMAASALADKEIEEAIPQMKKALDSDDNYLKGHAMLYLARLKEKNSYARIERLFVESSNPRIIIFGAAALGEIGDPEALTLLLEKAIAKETPKAARIEILLSITWLAGVSDGFYKFLKLYRENPDEAIGFLFEYFDSLNDWKLSRDFKDALEKFNEGILDSAEIVGMILDCTKDKKRKIIKTVDDFLTKAPADAIYAELIYALTAVFRKNGSL